MNQQQTLYIALQNQIYAQSLVQVLKQQGCRFVVISPGSRNTPLSLALIKAFEKDHLIAVDERSAAFIALGYARESQAYTILCCTSGSALTHYLPALTEAYYSGAPLVILSADRPAHLQGIGAAQTIDQKHIFGNYASFIQLPTDQALFAYQPFQHEIDKHQPESYMQGKQTIKIDEAQILTKFIEFTSNAKEMLEAFSHINLGNQQQKAIHINVPLEEPLWMEELDGYGDFIDPSTQRLLAQFVLAKPTSELCFDQATQFNAEKEQLQKLILEESSQWHKPPRLMIFLGAMLQQSAQAILPFLLKLKTVTSLSIYTEAASQLRAHPLLTDIELKQADLLSRLDLMPIAAELCVQIGTSTHSRLVAKALKSLNTKHILCADRRETPNPLLLNAFVSTLLPRDTLSLLYDCLQGLSKNEPDLSFAQILKPIDIALTQYVNGQEVWAGAIGTALNQIPASIAQNTALFIANSMPYRLLDLTLNQSFDRVWSARGTNGIDGNLSSVLGGARAYQAQKSIDPQGQSASKIVIAWLGDLAFLHDLQALLSLNHSSVQDVLIIVSNNHGGGIFQYLKLQKNPHFDHCFITPQHFDLPLMAQAFGLACDSYDHYDVLVRGILDYVGADAQAEAKTIQPKKPKIIELRLDSYVDYAHHQRLLANPPLSEQYINELKAMINHASHRKNS